MYKFNVLILVAAGVLLAACGPGASSSSGTGGPTTIPITMTEFKIDTPQTTFQAGVPYRFVVGNKGTVAHDFSISAPVMEGMNMGDAHEGALAVIDAADMPPGATKTIDLTFSEPMASSEIEFACHTPGHYEAGMKVPITVTQ